MFSRFEVVLSCIFCAPGKGIYFLLTLIPQVGSTISKTIIKARFLLGEVYMDRET